MRPIKRLRALIHQDVPFSAQVPLTHLINPTIVESANGHLISVIQLAGQPYQSETGETLHANQHCWHQALLKLAPTFAVYVSVHRYPIKIPTPLTDPGDHSVIHTLLDRYQQALEQTPFYQNDLFISLVYKGLTTGTAGKGLSLLKTLSHKTIKQSRIQARQYAMKQLEQARNTLVSQLKPFSPRVLGTLDNSLGYSQLLHFLSMIAGGGFGLTLPFANHLPVIAKSGSQKNTQTAYPHGHLGQYLTDSRIYFGRHIQWEQGIHTEHFADILSLKQYIAHTPFGIFERVLQLPAHLLMTQSFLIESDDVAIDRCHRAQHKLFAAKTASNSEAQGLSELVDAVAANRVRMGYHHATVMVIESSLKQLPITTVEVAKAFQASGITAVREQLGLEAAFFAQFPGNHRAIARQSLITSENFCAFNPLFNDQQGHPGNNHLGQPVTWLKTQSLAPYAFNYHAQGSQNNPSKGHAIIVGGNDSGKTVLLSFLDANLTRFGGRTILFDRNRGLELYVRACGGHYSVLAPDSMNTVAMNPLQMQNTAENIAFCKEWLVALVKPQTLSELPFDQQAPLHAAIDYVFAHHQPAQRTLALIQEHLPIDHPFKDALLEWMTPHSRYGYLFDHDRDSLSMTHCKHGFDMTYLLDHDDGRAIVPTLMYLFYRITQSLNGQLCSIVLDEGWQYLKHPYWRSKLEDWLPTIRKLNAHVVLATQSPSTIVQSPISRVLLDNVATQVFFMNPQAQAEDYQRGFNLTAEEFAIIKQTPPSSRQMLIKQAHESSVATCDLSKLDEWLSILSANEANIRIAKRLRDQLGDAWLPAFLQEVKAS
jgi:type IV secretion system protein VirB4